MGLYLNPANETKEEWLEREGERTSAQHAAWDAIPEGQLPVVLMDNGPFTAAGIAYKESELQAFTRDDDLRPRTIFLVNIDKLCGVSALAEYLADAEVQ